ncbi:hypothetical protein M408DRAFT_30179 [Serendipita vermifera MAFF 305830]|uniref:Lysine-specific metallo-endopeptidase domain-containing protein n=2 Tax=Serendipita vermifera MAFF 305830 TaxID=933852 RepID=A0A0C2W2G9_SERVB|nr:hypothetical protein M408DRAFT_30179 [Serendipita vermifera MAFF 305830]
MEPGRFASFPEQTTLFESGVFEKRWTYFILAFLALPDDLPLSSIEPVKEVPVECIERIGAICQAAKQEPTSLIALLVDIAHSRKFEACFATNVAAILESAQNTLSKADQGSIIHLFRPLAHALRHLNRNMLIEEWVNVLEPKRQLIAMYAGQMCRTLVSRTRLQRTAAQGPGNGQANFIAKCSFDHTTKFIALVSGETTDAAYEPPIDFFSQSPTATTFTSSGTGAYTVKPSYTEFYYEDPSTGVPTPITATVSSSFTTKVSARALAKRSTLGKRDIAVTKCASFLKDDVVLSAQVASLYVADAEKYLTLAANANSVRYETWFGTFERANHDRVLDHYGKIRKSDLKTYTFDCECTEGSDVFAYVFPDEFGHIHLCNQYIQAEVAGTDSKAGTIVHESSHFTLNGGTKDLAYGQTRAQALAVSNSTGATMNADSHECFAENSPALA